MTRTLLALALLLAPPLARAAEETAHAKLVDSTGKEVGTATVAAADGGSKLTVNVTGLKPGKHGFHLHAVGKCDAPDFKSAGPHYNPTHKKHGQQNPEGAHAGDLPNLEVGADGKGTATITAKDVKIADLVAGEGTALVIHADPDDGKTDPAGSSGARIACGVVQR
jgi:superoxide dismutase, Cu-Zn family